MFFAALRIHSEEFQVTTMMVSVNGIKGDLWSNSWINQQFTETVHLFLQDVLLFTIEFTSAGTLTTF